jgi:hypothetical protein
VVVVGGEGGCGEGGRTVDEARGKLRRGSLVFETLLRKRADL